MIRYCIYYLLRVGSKKLTLKEFEQILNQEKEQRQKEPALPNGLFLSKVEYPYLELENRHNLIRMLKLGLEK